jgi:hypothetical protein
MSYERPTKKGEVKKSIDEESQQRVRDLDARRQSLRAKREAAHKFGSFICAACNFTGTVIAKKGFLEPGTPPTRDYRDSYSFRCTACNSANEYGLAENYPKWDTKLSAEFELIKH